MSTSSTAPGTSSLERRAVGLPTAIGTTFGLIVAGTVMLTVAQGFAASWLFLVALGVGLFTMYLQAMSFSELATMIPKAGSMNEYVRAGLGTFFATFTVLVGYISILVFVASAEAFLAGGVLTGFLGAGLTANWWVIIVVAFVALLNLAGIRPFAVIEVFLALTIAASLAVFGIIGIAGLGTAAPVAGLFPPVDFSWGLLLSLLALAIFTFVGVEYTCPLAEELRRPERDIPWGIFIGLALVGIPVVLFGLAAVRFVSAEELGDPTQLTHMTVATAMLGETGLWWMGLMSVFASVSTLNAALAGWPRILYGMALTRQLPSPFAYVAPVTRAPAVGIVVLAVVPILMNVTGATEAEGFLTFILAGVLGWATAYFLIHLSHASLRLREPGAARPYRSPLFPLPQVLGIALLVLAAWKVFPDPEIQADIYRNYAIFVAAAVVFSFVYNAAASRSLTAQFRPVPLRDVYRAADAAGRGPLAPPSG